ncbi:MAG: decaprenyl-phosphate phosphoribosyltransferase [Ignavibacteriaceae bacterium]|nr:decaprenyl-phosphate phosphoribosyltransferase [Ignavibacteriaceae bacterium]
MIKIYFNLLRVPQWIKNFFIFVPLVFSQQMLELNYAKLSLLGFIIFSLISSSIYIINDIIDLEKDRLHPSKKFRPIAASQISKNKALNIAIVLALAAFSLLLFTNIHFSIAVISYFIITILYSTSLKNIVIIDVFIIAAGFILRILGGAFIINVEISSWLMLTTMFISLFLGVMKRRSELKHVINDDSPKTRVVLAQYSNEFIDQMSTVTSAGVIICYALYTVSQRTVSVFGTEHLIYTTPFVVFGIFRYMYTVYIGKKGESTSEILLSDLPMIFNIVLYMITVILIIY